MSAYYNVTTVAGNSTGMRDGSGYTLPNSSASNVALFSNLNGVVVDNSGTIFVSDLANHQIRKVTLVGTTYKVTTIAGSPAGTLGSSDGAGWTLPDVSFGSTALFNLPIGLAIDAYGNILVADAGNNRIRKITLVGTTYQVTTIAGSPTNSTGSFDGPGWTLSNVNSNSYARFHYPNGVAVDISDNIFVTDRNNKCVRKITLVGDTYQISTIAGNPLGATTPTNGPGWTDAGSNSTNVALFSVTLVSITTDLSGNIYVMDRANQRIRKIRLVGTTYQVSTIAGSAQSATGVTGSQDGQGWSLTDSNTGSVATFNSPFGIRADTYGNIIVADVTNKRIRKVSLVGNTYQVTTIAGSPSSAGGITDGKGWTLPNENSSNLALFHVPFAVSTDPTGNIYVIEANNSSLSRIRKIVLTLPIPPTPIILSPYSLNTTQSSPYIATMSGTIGIEGEANNTLFVSSTLSDTMYSYSSEVSSSGNAYIYYNLSGLISSSVSFTVTTQNTTTLQYSLPVSVYLSYITAALPTLLSISLSGSTHPNATIYASGETLYTNTSSGILILTVSGTSSNVIADISYSTLNVSGIIVGTTAYIPIAGLVDTNICVLTLKDTQNTILLYPFTIQYSTVQPSYPTVSIANTTYSTSGSPVLYTNQPSGTITISGDLNTQYIISRDTILDTSYTTTSSNRFTFPYTALSDLSHIYTLSITNIFNTTLTAYFTIVVETTPLTPPSLSISGAYVSDNIFYTNLRGADVTVSNLSTTSAFVSYVYSQTNSISYNAPDPSAPIPSYTLSIPNPGVYTVYVSCKDNEGNVVQLEPITIIR